jgi:chromosome segregation ATPase
MGQLEAQLTHQLDTIADTLSGQLAANGADAAASSAQSLAEVERLRSELEAMRVEWDTERESWQNERTQLMAADNDRLQTMEQRQRELESRQVTLDERATELNQQDRELRERQEQAESLERQVAEERTQLTAAESSLESQRSQLAEREQQLEQAKAELELAQAEFTASQTAHFATDAACQDQQAALAAERDAVAAERQQWDAERDAFVAEREGLSAERTGLTEEKAAFQLERVAFEAEREAFNEQVTAHSSLHVETGEATAALADLENQLQLERAAWERERTSVDEQRKLLAKERDDLTRALDAARKELATARETAGAAGELDELQQKFALALEDTQRLRARVAELEQELTSRPAASESDGLELVHLQAERDSLAERVGQLEKEVASAGSGASDSDLQRRFELAVEDVRDLKKRNAELEAQLAAAKVAAGGANPSVGGSSWEAMKRKMLANLEDEGSDVDDKRADERETIANTIRITDDALARKDREIAELKAQLVEGDSVMADAEESLRELVDSDEVISAHRDRIAKLEKEMQEKLRAAELELSIERAKIARETAQLADLKAELESQRSNREFDSAPGSATAATGATQHPRRRWLSKLGLSGEQEE